MKGKCSGAALHRGQFFINGFRARKFAPTEKVAVHNRRQLRRRRELAPRCNLAPRRKFMPMTSLKNCPLRTVFCKLLVIKLVNL
jgi:hypothetical protein